MTILIVGATGVVGGDIAHKLRKQGHSVRALVRGGAGHPKAQALQEANIEMSEGNLTQPATLDRACEGAETVISTATSMPSGANDGLRRVDHEGALALIDAAARAGVKRFIYTSYSGNIRIDSPLETAKRDCENRLLGCAMQAIILRPSYFMEMWLSPALGFDPLHGSVRIYGSGEARVNYISAFDVADFAVEAATRKYAEKNTILEMGGPEPLSQLDAVRIFEQVLKTKINLEHVPLEALEAQYRSATDPLQKTFAALTLAYAKGDIIHGAAALGRQYGIKLHSVEQYAAGFGKQTGESVA